MANKAKALQALISFLATTAGRDKSCRFFQYATRFFKAFLLEASKRPNQQGLALLAEKVDALGGSMGMTRKVLRWGRPIGIARGIIVLVNSLRKKDNEQSGYYVYFKVLAEISLALFFVFDHVLYLGRLKIVKDENLIARSDYLSNLFWLFECINTIIADCIQIHVLQSKLAEESISRHKTVEEITDIKERIDNAILNIIRSIIDVPIALHFMNSKFLEPGFVGILGSITSLIGCYQNWPKN